jgi:hypothetical protein
MWDENKLVGHYAVSPVNMIVEGEVILTALSMTTMTHPEYAGRGIFTTLAEQLYNEESKKSNLKAVWGFPNKNSHYAFINKLEWIDLQKIPTLSCSFDNIVPKGKTEVIIKDNFENKHVEAEKSVSQKQKIRIDKNLDYLNWRYRKNPSNEYLIFEFTKNDISYYAVTKIFRSFQNNLKFEIDVLELAYPADTNILETLFASIKDHYKNFDVLQINLWMSKNDPKFLILNKLNFEKTQPETYLGVRKFDTGLDILNESTEWFYSMGDSDVY